MAHTIITKNSSTAGAVPSAGSLTKGELAINVADRRLYSKDNAGNVIEVGGSGTVLKYRDNFTGDGSTVAFTLPRTPLNEELVDIYCDGVYQGKDTFSISGAVITFDEAPLSGASIEVITFQSSPIGETAANYVSYTPAGTGAVATTVQSKLRESVSVKDFGAVGDGVTDDTAAIQAAFNSSGLTPIYFPTGTYKITGSGAACLTLSKNKSLIGENSRTAIIRADSAGSSTDALKIAITDNGGFLDVRNFEMSGLTISQNGGGRHAVFVDAVAGYPMFSSVFDSLSLSGNETNNGCSFLVTGQGFAFNTIQNCTLTGTLAFDGVADGNRIFNNVIFGLRIGIYLDIVEGSYTTIVSGNTVVNRDGQVRVMNGSQILIDGNQFEQFGSYGPNTATYGPQVRITGSARACENIWITHNNFGGGANCANCLVLENAKDTRITQNVFCGSGSNTTNVDVLLLSNSSYNYLYSDNARGLSNGRTDKFNLSVTDSGTGNYGTLKQTAAPSSGGYLAGMFYYKDPYTEEVVLGPSNGGLTAPGTVIVTLPVGFKPYSFGTLPAASSAGAFVVATNPTTGDVTCGIAAPSNASVAEGVRIPAKRGA